MSNILVIGGLGYIGSHLVQKLKLNNNITILDNEFNIHSKQTNVKIINDSSNNIFKYSPDYDTIIHLGEYSRVEQSFSDIEKVIKFNNNGTIKVIEYCRVNNIRLIYANSSTTVGKNASTLSPYTFFKKQNTELIKNYGNWYNLNYSIVLFYNVYGKDKQYIDNKSTVISIFENLKKENKKISVVSPGTQKRNFTYIDDIINGIEIVLLKGTKDEYMIGNSEKFSILSIAKLFGDVEMLPERPGNRMDSILDTSKIEKLGWKCNQNLIDYINNL